ncbi:HNH endonuclease [Tenacibaculum sp. 190524A02b]|uniref:HNH endonuclease n=1 Tax=Tenacibaculum vairaonense TaxID=3137860 RepID=UPI0031FB6E7A
MQTYTKIYLEAFGLDETDFCRCETCTNDVRATEIHHILTRKKYAEGLNKIENLMAICRICHEAYGDRIYLMPMLLKIHWRVLELSNVKHDPEWFKTNIAKYEYLIELKECV